MGLTPKERAAMQQALEALESMTTSDWSEAFFNCEYDSDEPEQNEQRTLVKSAITALREALANSLKPKCFADYQPNHAIDRACASCAIADECRTGEQAEQDPVGYWDGKFSKGGASALYEVPQASAFGYHYENYPLYAAPVRTKDLTDEEITQIVREAARGSAINRDGSTSHRIARAVIAAYKGKNK